MHYAARMLLNLKAPPRRQLQATVSRFRLSPAITTAQCSARHEPAMSLRNSGESNFRMERHTTPSGQFVHEPMAGSRRKRRMGAARQFRLVAVASGVLLALLGALAASAEQTDFPSRPRAPGQSLIDWVAPAILSHDIAADQRGDERSCASSEVGDIETVALTCWPVLIAYKSYLRLDYAMNDPTSDASADRARAFGYVDAVLSAIQTPRFPLQYQILANTHRVRAQLLEQSGDFQQALAANAAELAARNSEPSYWNVPVRVRAHADRARLLLLSGQRREARRSYDNLWPILDEVDTEPLRSVYVSALIPAKDALQSIVIDALRLGDDGYAEPLVRAYMLRLNRLPSGLRIGRDKALELQLFMAVRKGDATRAAALMDELVVSNASLRDRTVCIARSGLFPFALAPIRNRPEIAGRLARLGCDSAFADRIAGAEATGVPLGLDRGFLPFVIGNTTSNYR